MAYQSANKSVISAFLTHELIAILDQMVANGFAPNRSKLIELMLYHWMVKKMTFDEGEPRPPNGEQIYAAFWKAVHQVDADSLVE